MNRAISPEATQKNLTNAIIKSHNHLGYSAIDWFGWMLDDCLAGFGKRLEKPWSDQQTKHLFELGGLYADTVFKNAYKDVLGGVYQELSSNYGRKALAQYFSPYAIASCMAKISYNADIFEKNKVVRVAEPAAGSGVMVLAFVGNLVDENPGYLEKVSLCCVDLDLTCVKMSTLQIMANNFIHAPKLGELLCLRGNSLGDPKELTTFFHASTTNFDNWSKEQEAIDKLDFVVSPQLEEIANETEQETEVVFIQPKKQMSIMDFFGA